MIYTKVTDNEDLVKDKSTGAVLNVDNQSLNNYRARRARQQEIDGSLSKIEKLESDVNEIKSLLYKILDREDNK
jgi:hypothetical protein